jgi:transposase
LPVRFVLTPGHRGDVIQAAALLDGLRPAAVIADKAYDADHLHQLLRQIRAEPVISPRPDRAVKHRCDPRLYKERNGVERMFARLKQFRRVATRYDKLISHFRGFVLIAAIVLWLR